MRWTSDPFDRHRRFSLFALVFAIAPAMVSPAADNHEALDLFETKIRPILVERCQGCHGSKKQWAALRLDSLEALLEGGDSGPAVTPGEPEKSELLYRISEEDDSIRMPPPEAGAPLSREEVAAFRRWIEQGATWPASAQPREKSSPLEHWAFKPITRPVLPKINANAQTPVDRFIFEKLSSEGLAPAEPADRRTLIRRVTYDLTGLPPTPAEVESFLADRSPDAYRNLVERLLSSPQYGEHWGRHWLDVARYSDTKGYVYGREERVFVHSWSYRDWVVRAFNADMPYDRFLRLQLAADQMPDAKPEDLAAMGYITVGRRFIGVTPDIIDDRIDVVGRGLMGLTVACARCHDHKYDPIPTADYYSLYGVFQSSCERLVPLPLAREADPAYLKELETRKQKLEETLAVRRAEAADRVRARLRDYLGAQLELEKYPELGFDQILAKEDLIPATVRRWQAYLSRTNDQHPIFGPWIAFTKLSDDDFETSSAEAHAELVKLPLHPMVREAFATPPASVHEVVSRYAELLSTIEKEWREAVHAAESSKRPAPPRLDDPAKEELRHILYGGTSPCVVPDEPIVNIESYFDSGTVNELWALQREVDRWLLQNLEAAPHALVLSDRDFVVEPQIFRRGNPANKGEVVPRQFLAVIAGDEREPFHEGSGRRELAEAIVAPSNPLTARVWVNRIWLHHFGAGLVTTPSDFGLRADPPSHPELLDWLASELIASGWSTKTIHRAIVLSSTYQQSSLPGSERAALALEKDPGNRLLWRQNSRRLSFEQFHDSLAFNAGELDSSLGGEPSDLFAPIAGKYRRALYGRIDRQFLPGVLRVFDFANPDLHSPQRLETSVPQQALFLLNHPYVAGRSKALNKRVEASGSDTDAAKVHRLYQLVYQRSPAPAELEAALEFLDAAARAPAEPTLAMTAAAWSYGYGRLDESNGKLSFEPLPYFDGAAWQGGPAWPDAKLGWAQLTATGGHAGNDLNHAVVRRWTASESMTLRVESEIVHDVAAGDGIRGWIVSNRHGILMSATIHNRSARLDVGPLQVQAGDTLDFVVDFNANLNSDQFQWSPVLRAELPVIAGSPEENMPTEWNAERDFAGPRTVLLAPFEQLCQLLLVSNESTFVD